MLRALRSFGFWATLMARLMAAITARLTDAHRQLLAGPLAVQVSSATADLQPLCARGWGVEVSATDQLTFFALDAQTVDLRRALGQSGRAAVNVTNPVTLQSLLFKGRVVLIAEPDQAAREAVDQRLTQFVHALSGVGFPDFTRGFNHPGPARRVVLQLDGCFEQTPGAKAGRPLEGA